VGGNIFMVFSPDSPKQIDEAPYNSRLIKNYLEYVKKFHPEVDIDPILSYAGVTTYQVEDQGHWFTQEQVDRFHEMLIQKTRDPDISREVGRFAGSSQASSAVRQYALGFITPASAYWMAQKISSNLSRGFSLKTKQITHNKIEVAVTPKPGVKEKLYQCENRMGLLESVAKLFTNKFAEIEHPSCLHRGDEVGRYIISWEKTPFLIWKRLFNYFFLAGIGIFSGLFFVLPIVPWCISFMLYGFLSMMFFFYSGHLEKKHLTKTIETQGDAAKDLLNEMNIRYNNALLVQEIGQATSTILDIDKVVSVVVSIMEKRLDFDRGMIMLRNDEKTRLVYNIGYGYSQEVEGLLRNTDFHLDNPNSRGVVVRAYKEQKPFLVNDIAHIEKDVSAKSLEFVKQIGGESFVSVPIVYEKESLGVILVDNLKSKRQLRQSDVNLLMGVASQTAVNIVEAISFQKLQESEKKYRDLVENANSIILRMDTKGNIIFFNEFAQRFFGYSENEVLGKNIQGTILPGAESTKRNFGELMTSLRKDPERPVASEDEYVLRNGEKAWIAWTYKPIFDDEGHVVEILCIGNDITGLRRAEHEKEDLEAQLRGAQKMEAIGTLAGGIAHDFNNILQAIFSYIQILLMKKDQSDPDYDKFKAIEKSVQRASELTRRLLIFSRKVKSKLKPVDLNQEVVQVSKMLEMTIPKMITIELKLAGNLKTINADPVQIEQIMMNLGVNARDAMPNGGNLNFETENVILDEEFCKNHLGSRPGEYVLLGVSDTGHGIDQELQTHIFEPFFTTKETGKGTGLGLAMVYGIVKSHGGYITCDSEPGRGTTFRIYFPVMTSDAEAQDSIEVELSIEGGNETILLVDDEENIRKPGKEMLADFGYTVLTASDGEGALELYSKEYGKINLVILDLIMPGMGGSLCLQELVKINPLAKVIIASGYSISGLEKEVIEAKSKGFIRKPYNVREMLNLVREVLDRG
jgi:PAS domain S-box-containing protein